MMKQLADELGLLNLVHKQATNNSTELNSDSAGKITTPVAETMPKEELTKEEMRLLVKILKAIGHTCEHQHIKIKQGITHYQLNQTTLIFDDVNKNDTNDTLHLSPLSLMLDNPEQKRPAWEKLKTLKST